MSKRWLLSNSLQKRIAHQKRSVERQDRATSLVQSSSQFMDVMDGAFVPNITFGGPVVKSLAGKTKLPFDVHLMIEDPMKFIDSFAEAGADMITFHVETVEDPYPVIEKIHSLGKRAGMYVKVINTSEQPQKVELSFSETVVAAVERVDFTSKLLYEDNTLDAPDRIKPVHRPWRGAGKTHKVEIPAQCFSIFVLER